MAYSKKIRYISGMGITGGVGWNNTANAINNEDDNYADSNDIPDMTYAGYDMQDVVSASPTSLDLFVIKHMDINSEQDDDTFYFQIYNPETTNWEPLETFTTASKLPQGALALDTYTAAMQTKFNAATNKTTFINGLQGRLYCEKTKGSDNVNWGMAFCKLIYSYTVTVGVAATRSVFQLYGQEVGQHRGNN
jgi:hypothetical protein